ncbi:MAG: UDP-N-acetylmuramoyl-L-alanyl-D-glutamate--2,6-diaminopimelate ligase [Planctomycetes bacterium]|nr:UDP-N-acetylmuramoyl-L-alanyl-D-glutamate--2,6-diaminopimelate ligase [Planctomycetota bacterium]
MLGATEESSIRPRMLADLLARAGLEVPAEVPPGVALTLLTDDSRKARPGACFVAVRGAGVDGHQFVDAAVRNGATTVVVEHSVPLPRGVLAIPVRDSRSALARLAAAFHDLRGGNDGANGLSLLGITGTNGKTTVAWMLRSILSAAGARPALLGTIEYDLVGERLRAPLTTPGAVELCRHLARAREAGATHAVMEVSSHALDQCRTDGLRFSAAVFTNLTGDHLDYHRTMEAYRAAKRRLFTGLGGEAFAIINADDPAAAFMSADLRARVVSVGMDARAADVSAHMARMGRMGSSFVLRGRTFETEIHCRLPGRHNVLNALCAAAAAEAIGVCAAAVRTGLEQLNGVPGRLQRVERDGCPFSVLVDYAHTDDALRNVLQAVRPLTTGRVLCVFGCGGDRDRSKRPRMAAVVGQLADVAVVTSDNPRSEDPQAIIAEILRGFEPGGACRVQVEADRKRAIELAIGEARPGDTVLIAGKGHEDYQLIGGAVLEFDDASVARTCLEASAAVMEEVA